MKQPWGEDPGGEADVRVAWVPGRAGDLFGTCRCGARFSAPDPTAVWNWYSAHGHSGETTSGWTPAWGGGPQ
jgi:hypothetical protein